MIFKKIVIALLLGTSTFSLSGCFLHILEPVGQQARLDQQDRTNKQINQNNMALNPALIPQEKPTNTAPATSTTKSDLTPPVQLSVDSPAGEPIKIIDIINIKEVFNGGTSPTVTFKQSYYLTEITTYHWNKGNGTPAGTIALQDKNGKTYGPWAATLVSGVDWTAKPSFTIPAGSYTVIDSDPSTWAQNTDTAGQGMTWAMGIPVK